MSDHLVTVVRTTRVSPSLIRIRLAGDDLPDDYSTGVPDEYAGLTLPSSPGAEVTPGEDPVRYYTIRRFVPDHRELDVDVVVHEGGVGATWALTATPGDQIVIGTPHGAYARPGAVAWEWLVGDLTALPAIGRIVEQHPGEHALRIDVVVPDPDDEQELATADGTAVRWHSVSDPTDVADVLRDLVVHTPLPNGPGYVWVAGEASGCRAARRHLRHDLGLPASAYTTLGYWRVAGERWDTRYREVEQDLAPRFDDLYARYQDQLDDAERLEDYVDEVERLYDEHGLG